MTEPEIRPRVDEETGARWCDDGCPQYKDVLCHCGQIHAQECVVTGENHDEQVCPVWASRLAAENRKLREWARRAGEVAGLVLDAEAAIAPDVPIVIGDDVFNLMEELLKTYPAATEDGVE